MAIAPGHVERMWIEVDRVGADAPRYSGWLTNKAHNPGVTQRGMRVWFGPEHVIDIAYANETLASESPDVLRCTRHGPSQTTYVCQHLPRGTNLGFHQAEDPGGRMLRRR